MATENIEDLYLRVIKPLPSAERQRLLTLLSRDLAEDAEDGEELDLRDLEGLGAEIWEGVDAQEYVNALRDEWDHRPCPRFPPRSPMSRGSVSIPRHSSI